MIELSGRSASISGSTFGMPGYFRLSFATAMEEIKEGLRRIEKYLKNG
jgi:aspartate/methionine/tyrosine aminotransferase